MDFSPLPFSTLYILMGEVAAAANTTFIYFKDLGFVRPAMGSFINYVDKQGDAHSATGWSIYGIKE